MAGQRSGYRVSQESKKRMQELRDEGLSISIIAERMNVSENTVKNHTTAKQDTGLREYDVGVYKKKKRRGDAK
jgi:transposase